MTWQLHTVRECFQAFTVQCNLEKHNRSNLLSTIKATLVAPSQPVTQISGVCKHYCPKAAAAAGITSMTALQLVYKVTIWHKPIIISITSLCNTLFPVHANECLCAEQLLRHLYQDHCLHCYSTSIITRVSAAFICMNLVRVYLLVIALCVW